MQDGKKSIAYNIFYDAVNWVERTKEKNGLKPGGRPLNNIIMPSVK